jgi:hypothetical protein
MSTSPLDSLSALLAQGPWAIGRSKNLGVQLTIQDLLKENCFAFVHTKTWGVGAIVPLAPPVPKVLLADDLSSID